MRTTELTDLIHELLRRSLSDRTVRALTRLGEGADHVAYEVNGELIVRVSKEDDADRRGEWTRREAELLMAVAGWSTLPVPEPVLVDDEAGVLAYVRLPGVPLLGRSVAEPGRLAAALGEFLSYLHRAPLNEVEKLVERDTYPLAAWREEAERTYQTVAAHLPAPARRLVEDFLGRPLPAASPALAFCHNDLGAEHVLVEVGSHVPSGVIDWADAAIADPLLDFARLYRDLGPGFYDLLVGRYEGRLDDADRERTAFYARCTLLEDLAFGIETGARAYAQNALGRLDQTFAYAVGRD